jgi:hypothetical protein
MPLSCIGRQAALVNDLLAIGFPICYLRGMSDTQNQERSDRPGKTRTWWHPLLARLMDHLLCGGYSVQEEVLVGKLPLRVDILLVRREGGGLSEASRRDLSVLVPLLNRYTLIEFKGPTDSVEPGDAAQLFGCSFLWL